jgi:hypothetical protein
MEGKLAYYEMKDQTAIVTIDHPPMNALDVATKEAIGEVFMGLPDRGTGNPDSRSKSLSAHPTALSLSGFRLS